MQDVYIASRHSFWPFLNLSMVLYSEYTKTIYFNENPAAGEIGKEWLFASLISSMYTKRARMMEADGFVTVHPHFN